MKTFRKFNGLEVLASYMCDTQTTDWEMKLKIIQCIDHVPVTAQQQVQTNSDLMGYVKQWSVDPRYCKSRPDVESLESLMKSDVPEQERQQEQQPLASGDQNGGSVEPPQAENGEAEKVEEVKEEDAEALANAIKIYSPSEEREVIESIRRLASEIHERWSRLPSRVFRIPRVESRPDGERNGSKSPPPVLLNQSAPQEKDIYRLWRMSSRSPKRR